MVTPRTRTIANELLSAAPGFKVVGNGGVLRGDGDGVAQLIFVDRGKYTTTINNPVTLMLGAIPIRAVELLRTTVPKEIRKGPMYWPWWRRIGHLMPERRDMWWDLGPEESPADRSGLEAMRRAIQDHGLPSLSVVGTERGLFGELVKRFDRHGDGLPYGELRWFAALARVLGEERSVAAGIAAMQRCGVEEESLQDDLEHLG